MVPLTTKEGIKCLQSENPDPSHKIRVFIQAQHQAGCRRAHASHTVVTAVRAAKPILQIQYLRLMRGRMQDGKAPNSSVV